MYEDDTIAAVSTGMTSSGIGIVRMSGRKAVEIADRVFSTPGGRTRLADVPSHTVHYGHVYDEGVPVDEVMACVMRAPRTYTREDVVEISCHGGIVVMRTLLAVLLKNGARLAQPGEFTKRAFLNGRIDLSQAEAVIDLINSSSRMAMDSSLRQLQGGLGKKIRQVRQEILDDTAYIEASLDDPEHISMEGYRQELLDHVKKEQGQLLALLHTARNGKIIREGIRTVIVGKPNAGKSSLMNLLLGSRRAIVTDIAGTTRDTLEESMLLDGIPLQIVDTAGIRRTDDLVEKIGVEKALEAAKDAQLILFAADSSLPLDENDREIARLLTGKKVVVLLNKSDLPQVIGPEDIKELIDAPVIPFSAAEGTGVRYLEKIVKEMFFSGSIDNNEQIYLSNERHQEAVSAALDSLMNAEKGIEEGIPEDLLTIDFMEACDQLGLITGQSVGEDLIDTIFSRFCMGK